MSQRLPAAAYSPGWRLAFQVLYAGLGLLDPIIRMWWRLLPLGNIVDLQVAGHRSGRTRHVLLGLLRDGDHWFLGHPNGPVAWTTNLAASSRGALVIRPGNSLPIRARALEPGPLRDRAIMATTQHVFPGNLVYRLAWGHIRAVGAFFEIEPADDDPGV